jgi:hypothetical protein
MQVDGRLPIGQRWDVVIHSLTANIGQFMHCNSLVHFFLWGAKFFTLDSKEHPLAEPWIAVRLAFHVDINSWYVDCTFPADCTWRWHMVHCILQFSYWKSFDIAQINEIEWKGSYAKKNEVLSPGNKHDCQWCIQDRISVQNTTPFLLCLM